MVLAWVLAARRRGRANDCFMMKIINEGRGVNEGCGINEGRGWDAEKEDGRRKEDGYHVLKDIKSVSITSSANWGRKILSPAENRCYSVIPRLPVDEPTPRFHSLASPMQERWDDPPDAGNNSAKQAILRPTYMQSTTQI